MNNEKRDQALYRYPNSTVLRNKLGYEKRQELDEAERLYVSNRIDEGVPEGKFDLEHLQRIHKHLFQDVYEWAGEIRQTVINKGEGQNKSIFPLNPPIEFAMADVHKRLRAQNFLRDLPRGEFAREAAEYIGDVNRLHPFREGNGRTQFQYLKQLGGQAGHTVDLTRFERQSWIQASIEANAFDSERMAACIDRAIVDPDKSRVQDKPRQIEDQERRGRRSHTPSPARRKNFDRDR